jgi:hypothetical protein
MEITNNIPVSGPAFRFSQSRPAKMFDSLSHRLSTNKITLSQKDGSRGSTEPLKGHFGVDKLETIHSRFNSVARTIRVADENMGKIENYIDRMKTELQRIVKNYPPFPPGSEERVKRLKSVNAFRRLIDQLTIPPPNEEFAAKIMPDHDVVSKTNDSQKVLSESNLRQTRLEGIDIPQLPEDANDEKIYAFAEKLDAAGEMLRQSRSDLATYAAEVREPYEQEVEDAGIFHNYGDEFESVDTEAETELKSRELGYALAIEPGMTLTEAQSQLLSLLN